MDYSAMGVYSIWTGFVSKVIRAVDEENTRRGQAGLAGGRDGNVRAVERTLEYSSKEQTNR